MATDFASEACCVGNDYHASEGGEFRRKSFTESTDRIHCRPCFKKAHEVRHSYFGLEGGALV